MLKIFNPQVLHNLIHEAPERTGKTIRKSAMEMGGIDEKYLARQINPDDQGAKLGVEDFVYLTAVTDTLALDYIEQAFGRVAVPIPIPDQNINNACAWYKHIAKVTKGAGECVATLADSLADGVISPDEIRQCRQESYEALQALAALWQHLKEAGDK